MSEPTNATPNPEPQPNELEALRRANSELVSKKNKYKARVAELEAAQATADTTIAELRSSITDLTINGPLQAMAESISVAPEAFLTAFQADYKLELREGKLTMLTQQGEPVVSDGKPVPFERDALKAFLLSTKDEAKQRLYRAVIIMSHASGGISPTSASPRTAGQQQQVQFGLR